MRFVKMHGIGNDYIYVNCFNQTIDQPQELARVISDRHTGVGGDGLILVLPPSDKVDADVRMRMFNNDGSEAEMCGNGIRCVCKLAHDQDITSANPMRIQTKTSVLSLDYTVNRSGKIDQITVNMGQPTLNPENIPICISDLKQIVNYSTSTLVQWPGTFPEDWKELSGLDQRMTCVSMGNPHAVFYCNDVAAIPLETVGPVLENHHIFPNRINVHFVQPLSRSEVIMRTWERGSGVTQACGSGASAVCVAGVLIERTNRELLAHLPGGDLQLRWAEDSNHVFMTGAAAEVFRGEWPD